MVSNSPCFNAALGANRLHNALNPTSINRVKTTLKKRDTPEVKEVLPEPETPSLMSYPITVKRDQDKPYHQSTESDAR